jgi:hypothetical protein
VHGRQCPAPLGMADAVSWWRIPLIVGNSDGSLPPSARVPHPIRGSWPQWPPTWATRWPLPSLSGHAPDRSAAPSGR